MYRRVIYDFIWFRDVRGGFVVFGDILVLTVQEQAKIGFCYSKENSHGRRKSDRNNKGIMFFVWKQKETNSVKRVNGLEPEMADIKQAEQLVPKCNVRSADWKCDASRAEGSIAVISYRPTGERVSEASQLSQQTFSHFHNMKPVQAASASLRIHCEPEAGPSAGDITGYTSTLLTYITFLNDLLKWHACEGIPR